jgi:5,10-methylenetetrahydrofolate reductase
MNAQNRQMMEDFLEEAEESGIKVYCVIGGNELGQIFVKFREEMNSSDMIGLLEFVLKDIKEDRKNIN